MGIRSENNIWCLYHIGYGIYEAFVAYIDIIMD